MKRFFVLAAMLMFMCGVAFGADYFENDRMAVKTMTNNTSWFAWTATEDIVNVKMKAKSGITTISTTSDASVTWTLITNEVIALGENSKITTGKIYYMKFTGTAPGTVEIWGRK